MQTSSTVTSMDVRGHKYVWRFFRADTSKSIFLSEKLGLSRPVADVLVSRGFDSQEKALSFLFSDFERDVDCATKLKDAVKTVDRIEQAIASQEKILLFGDYDVDGMTSVAIAILALLPLGAKVNFVLPHREKDGYGISVKFVRQAAKASFGLIITVDNGTTAHAAAEEALKLGIDLIVTDHHQPKEDLPDVFALVNPHQAGCCYPNKNFCGAGVIFKLMYLLYQRRKLQLPEKVYELLMLGTIADMVPMDLENRYWVRRGLSSLQHRMSHSFLCMAHNAGLNPDKLFWSAQDIGFFIAPQLNALGRLDNPRDAVKFLVSSDKSVVEDIAQKLKDINERRKTVDRNIFEQVSARIKSGEIDLERERVIMAADSSWPSGVIGLVAGKLMSTYGRPTFLFHLAQDGLAKGSCRSIEQFNVFKALEANKDLLKTFGGHSCAAGLSLDQEDLPLLKARLEKMVAEQVSDYDLQPSLRVDASLDLLDANKKLLSDLRMLEPFGSANPVPNFLVKNVVLVRRPELLKQKHLKCLIFSEGILKPVIFFNRPELYELFLENEDRAFDLVANVSGNEWGGRTSVDLIGLDVRFYDR